MNSIIYKKCDNISKCSVTHLSFFGESRTNCPESSVPQSNNSPCHEKPMSLEFALEKNLTIVRVMEKVTQGHICDCLLQMWVHPLYLHMLLLEFLIIYTICCSGSFVDLCILWKAEAEHLPSQMFQGLTWFPDVNWFKRKIIG